MEYLLERIKAGTLISTAVEIPDRFGGGKINIRLLTNQDVLEATLAADRIFSDAGIPVSFQNIKVYEAEKDVQHLYRACTDGEGKPLAANVTEFRKLLTVVDKGILIDYYNKLDEENNPSIDTISDAEFDTLVEAVKKNPNTVSNVSSMNMLRRLAHSLASALASLQKDSGLT